MIPTPKPNAYEVFGDIEQQAKEAQEIQAKEEQQLNNDFFSTFSTPAGRNVFNYFKKFTLDLPCIPKGMPYQDAILEGAGREGENRIVREMKFRSERGSRGE